ncbi:MAG: hypothetical protein GDA38_21285 [Hormoscilla sp. SP12CHS1]|nr:hypothetical protein [Hormoscilla sp. SP12CHS1]
MGKFLRADANINSLVAEAQDPEKVLVGVELGVAPQSSLTEVCSEDGSPHYKPQKNRHPKACRKKMLASGNYYRLAGGPRQR